MSTTRRNHTGNFTTTIVLDSGRIYGHGRTKALAQEAAQRILAAHLELREQAAAHRPGESNS